MTPQLSRRLVLAAPALLLAGRARAVMLNEAALTQGGFVVGRAAPGTRLALDGRAVRVSPAGDFAFGFGRDHAAQARLAITAPAGAAETRVLNIAKRQWPTESISGLPPAQVTPDAETLTRIAREREKLGAIRALESGLTGFAAAQTDLALVLVMLSASGVVAKAEMSFWYSAKLPVVEFAFP